MSAVIETLPPAKSSSLKNLVARHPVAAFLVMMYAFGWSSLLAAAYYNSFGLPPLIATLLGTIFAFVLPAFLVTAATSGQGGVRDLVSRCLRWRVGLGWYLLALLGFPLATLLVASGFLGTAPVEALTQKWPLVFTLFLPAVLIPLVLTHLFEEAAWTGFLQDRLQGRQGPLLASILVALAFALWHLPLNLLGNPQIVPALVQFAAQVFLAVFLRVAIMWLYNSTGRSLLIVALFHSAFNSMTGSTDSTRFIRELISGSEALLIASAVIAVMAVILSLITRGRLAYRPNPPAQSTAVGVP